MRRPGLPVTMLQGGGAAAAGVGVGAADDGLRPGLGHPASVASIFFPEGSMRSGKVFGPPRAPSVSAGRTAQLVARTVARPLRPSVFALACTIAAAAIAHRCPLFNDSTVPVMRCRRPATALDCSASLIRCTPLAVP